MRCIGLCLLLALAATPLSAQWRWINPLPQGDALYDLCARPDGSIWVTGGNGTILARDPHSGNWRQLHTMVERTPVGIREIVFLDSTDGFVLTNVTVLATSDGGVMWSALPDPGFSIHRLLASPGGAVWASGGAGNIARWNGTDWETHAAPVGGDPAVCFVSEEELFAAGPTGIIAHSIDGGANWTTTQKGTGIIGSISFGSRMTGIAIQSSNTLLRTMDGGATWKDTTLPVNMMTQVLMTDSLRGWLVTNTAGMAFRTTNAGATWSADTIDPGLACTFQAISSPSPSDAVIIGNRGEVYRTTDFGASWTLLGSAITRNSLASLSKSVDGAIFAFGQLQVLRSFDQGDTWTILPHPANLRSGAALSTARLVAVSDSTIWTSADSGAHWSGNSFGGAASLFYDVSFADSAAGWAVGQPGAILRTTDGGSTWIQQASHTGGVLYAAAAISQAECWAVGQNGLVLHTTDGGTTWSSRTLGPGWNFRAVRFINRQNGWAAGDELLYRTTDAGATWTDLSYAAGTDAITAIDAADPGRLMCMKPYSVMRSIDGGSTFYREDYPCYTMTDLLILPGDKAVAAGQNGAILKYEPAPYMSVAPSPLLFGSVEVGKSGTAELILSNRGERVLAIDSATLVAKGFTLETPLYQVLVGAQDFIHAQVRFTPAEVRSYDAFLSIWSNDLPGVQTIELRGEGIAPVLPVLRTTPNPVDFGIVKMNAYAPLKVAITNTGQDAILINSETITGPDSTSFYILKESGYFLAKGATDTIALVFRPLATGALSAFLSISSSDPNMPVQNVALTGTGIAPILSAGAQEVDFGPVLINTTAQKSLIVLNTGSADAAISGATIGGADQSLFSIVRSLPPVLTAKHLDSLEIAFLPTTLGDKQATLRIDSDDPVNPSIMVNLKGRSVSTLAVGPDGEIPTALEFLPLYPNPFGPGSGSGSGALLVTYRLAERTRVTLEVFSLLGERIAILADGMQDAGFHTAEWKPGVVPPGDYFIRIGAAAGNGRVARLRTATYLR